MGGIFVHFGDNRSGKTFTNALFAWEAYNRGLKVYCNCPLDPRTGKFVCILNFPHYHYSMEEIFHMDLYGCYLITDEGVENMDSRTGMSKRTQNISYFGYQAKKRDLQWHYDTVLTDNIEKRIRKNPDYWIETKRIPRDINKPLIAIKMMITPRYGTGSKTVYWTEPWNYYPIYNSIVLVPPGE
jgi:hypothetical protein